MKYTKRILYTIAAAIVLCACDNDYHPYSAGLTGSHDINTRNISLLEKADIATPYKFAFITDTQGALDDTADALEIIKSRGDIDFIIHVDISASKSMWYGESEKIIKEIFTKYRRQCKRSVLKPILLFNEADAIFASRKTGNNSSIDQTENAIQNIILEEMECLDGILIATTNLADNLDKAFERRFLFKIRFDKPSIEAKTKIWRDKLSALSEAEAHSLAIRYDFSGGEIDNIVRKSLMSEVIEGKIPSFNEIEKLCTEEKMGRSAGKRVGFNTKI